MTAETGREATAVQSLRVLIVDDELAIARVLGLILCEHEVAMSHSCREAREALGAREFDVILCDLSLPDGSGIEVYEYLRALRPGHEARVGFLSGGEGINNRTRNVLTTLKNPFLDKPFTIEEIRTLIDQIVQSSGLSAVA